MTLDLSQRLSDHFALREMIVTAHRTVDNTPTPEVIAELMLVCNRLLEPVRQQFGPLWVTSGYRCGELNTLIGGSKTSAHVFGCAADFVPVRAGVTTTEIVEWIVASDLPFDQVIDEHSSTADWVHLAHQRPGIGKDPRRQALTMRRGKYTPFISSACL